MYTVDTGCLAHFVVKRMFAVKRILFSAITLVVRRNPCIGVQTCLKT